MRFFLQIRNLFLFKLALLSIFRFGRRDRIPSAPRTVLLVNLAKLGDMVCFTPVLHALRKGRPHARITVMGDKLNRELLEGSLDFDEYVVFTGKLFSTIREIKKIKPDVAIVRGTGFVPLVLAILGGARAIIAPKVIRGKPLATKTYNTLLPFVRTVDFSFGEYMPRQFLRLLEPLGIYAEDTTKRLFFSDAASAGADAFLTRHGIDRAGDLVVGITPSAGNKIKEWPAERFAQVADHLAARHGAKIILIGGPADKKLLDAVETRMKEKVAARAQGLRIGELKALIARLNLLIAVDTGPIYIAEAFGTPTIDIVGPVDEREQPPLGFIHRNVLPPGPRRPEMAILNARGLNYGEARRQTLSITVPMVTDKADKLLEDLSKRKKENDSP